MISVRNSQKNERKQRGRNGWVLNQSINQSINRLTNLWPLDSRSNWNLEMLVFEERKKPEYPEKNLSEQGREPTTNSTQI